MNRWKTRIAILMLDGFLAVTALWGALLVVPQLPTSLLRSGPFIDFTIPAFVLGSVGILAAVGGLAIFWRPPVAAIASIVAGGAIVIFEVVEAAAVGSLLSVRSGFNDRDCVAPWLQPFYALVGVGISASLTSASTVPGNCAGELRTRRSTANFQVTKS